MPNRSAANQLYVPELDRIVLKDKVSARAYINTATVRKTTITTRVMQLIHQVSALTPLVVVVVALPLPFFAG